MIISSGVAPLVLAHFVVAVLQFMPGREGDRQLNASVALLAQGGGGLTLETQSTFLA